MDQSAALVRAAVPERRERKAPQDYVTDVDLRLDSYLEEALAKLTPGVPVLSEERLVRTPAGAAEWWIVDPLDGTANLIAGIPFVGVSAALVDSAGPLFAAVAAPFQNRIWSAGRELGAFTDTVPLRLKEDPPELVVTSTGILDRLQNAAKSDNWLALRRIGKVRNLGAQSLHLCGVASGWFAGAISIEARIWDEAAGGLIVREAGGMWSSNADSADWQDPASLMEGMQESVACHPSVYEALAAIVAGCTIDTDY